MAWPDERLNRPWRLACVQFDSFEHSAGPVATTSVLSSTKTVTGIATVPNLMTHCQGASLGWVAERTGSVLSPLAARVRARCERTAVERCRTTFDEKAEFGSVMLILSIAVSWSRVIGWICKPEAAGSNPARSILRSGHLQGFLVVFVA
jgi:hypothetical protein